MPGEALRKAEPAPEGEDLPSGAEMEMPKVVDTEAEGKLTPEEKVEKRYRERMAKHQEANEELKKFLGRTGYDGTNARIAERRKRDPDGKVSAETSVEQVMLRLEVLGQEIAREKNEALAELNRQQREKQFDDLSRKVENI